MTKQRKAKDMAGKFEEGIIIDSDFNDDMDLVYFIEYEEDGQTKKAERQAYQIQFL